MKQCIVGIAVVLCLVSGVVLSEPSLTIYNQNFAVVRDTIRLDLKQDKGNDIQFTDITAHLEPDSVILRDPTGKRVLQVVEQNYLADPVSQQLLLSLYEGKEIEFFDKTTTNTVKGKIIRSGYVPHAAGLNRYGQQYRQAQMAYAYSQGGTAQPVIEVNGKLRFQLPGEPLFPALTSDTILKPTLSWIIDADKPGVLNAELCYVTGGMDWEADYNIVAPPTGETLDLVGWVTMDNQSGKTFEQARIKLMAGDVSKLQREGQQDAAFMYGARAGSLGGPMQPVTEKAFEDYHLYTLDRRTTLHDRETKQVEFVRANAIKSQRLYVYDGADIDYNRYRGYSMENIREQREYGTKCNPKVWVVREFGNTQDNHLGIPLPKGRVRFYRRDDDAQLEFTGENMIDHTPKDENVRIYTGNAFDIVGERRRTDYKMDSSRNWLDESFEIKLRNRKEKEEVEIRVVEHLYRWSNWDIVEKSNTFLKTDSQTVEFRVMVPAGGEQIITYKVHYTW